jgi:hypothetical protein
MTIGIPGNGVRLLTTGAVLTVPPIPIWLYFSAGGMRHHYTERRALTPGYGIEYLRVRILTAMTPIAYLSHPSTAKGHPAGAPIYLQQSMRGHGFNLQ